MPAFTQVTARDPERFRQLNYEMPRADGPEFLDKDRAVVEFWPQLVDTFPDYQFCLVDDVTGLAAGVGRCLPLDFDGGWSDLPDGGLDWALEKGFSDQTAGHTPRLVSALYIEVAETHRGQGLSGRMLATMKEIASAQGFRQLIAPVRPSMKSRYPLIDIDTYLSWTTPEGHPIDPWLRVHTRAGGKVLHACRRAMMIEGTAEQWAVWTGMAFPGDGDFIIPYGLVPVRVRSGWGEYIEPGVWVLHEIG